MEPVPIAILTADWHLRDSTPVCRTDDFEAEQWRKVDWIFKKARIMDVPILLAGDVFHKWNSSPYLIRKAIEAFHPLVQVKFITGNHDLPRHSKKLYGKSALSVLDTAHAPHTLKLGDMEGSTNIQGQKKNFKVKLLHELVWQHEPPFPGAPETGKVENIFKRYPEYDIIVTGDNHIPLYVGNGEQVLVNPGSLMRQSANQIDYEPRVYVLCMDGTAYPLLIPISEDVVSREHLDRKKERDDRISAFVEKLGKPTEIHLNFRESLMEKLRGVDANVKERVMEALGDG